MVRFDPSNPSTYVAALHSPPGLALVSATLAKICDNVHQSRHDEAVYWSSLDMDPDSLSPSVAQFALKAKKVHDPDTPRLHEAILCSDAPEC